MHQIKGNSETSPAVSPDDGFADFEQMETKFKLGALDIGGAVGQQAWATVRGGLQEGLRQQEKVGVNPFQVGFVGGGDDHSGQPGDTEADDYAGSHGMIDDSCELRLHGSVEGGDFTDDDLRDLAAAGYSRGVPMGSELAARPRDAKAPTLLVHAAKDAAGANLDRIQVVKCWTHRGMLFEKIYDVAASGGRVPDPVSGALPPVGSTVDVNRATYTNDIGATELSAAWTDLDFDPSVPCVYYARILEIPTPPLVHDPRRPAPRGPQHFGACHGAAARLGLAGLVHPQRAGPRHRTRADRGDPYRRPARRARDPADDRRGDPRGDHRPHRADREPGHRPVHHPALTAETASGPSPGSATARWSPPI